jgi:hypothetical protein
MAVYLFVKSLEVILDTLSTKLTTFVIRPLLLPYIAPNSRAVNRVPNLYLSV